MENTTTTNHEARTIGSLLRELFDEARDLFRQEVALAKTEATEKASLLGKNVAFIAAGGLVAFAGALFILAALSAPIASEPSEAGTRDIDLAEGLPSRTEFRVLERFPDHTTLMEARPITGRTNQIRAHLWQLGCPIVGDPVYQPHHQITRDTQTLSVDSTPLYLHAWRLKFRHPLTLEPVSFEAPAPSWANTDASTAHDVFSHGTKVPQIIGALSLLGHLCLCHLSFNL